jgi:imidazoleglycerol-phosphate dehydratase
MRKATIKRKTSETQISASLDIDGSGKAKIATGIGILDHMLQLFAFHGLFDLEILAQGDLKVDTHHTNEDVGIVLGEVFKKALGDKKGIRRFGSISVPMEEVVAAAVVDISGRGALNFNLKQPEYREAGHFFEAFAKHLGMNLNIKIENISPDLHTTLEPAFKALGIALDQATQIDPRRKGIPSTKGVID